VAERVSISIVIPSFNQGEFIEETLQSIFMQEGAEYEVLVFDGGSTDETTDVLNRYSERIAYWESAPDRGQSHAINRALERITGDVWMYLNSDDLLAPGALATVSQGFADPNVVWISGACENFDETGIIGGVKPGPVQRMKDYLAPWKRRSQFVFPFSGACYMRREIVERIGHFDESYRYSMDMEYYCRAAFEGRFSQTIIPDVLARWRWHSASKTMRQGIAYAFRAEEIRIAQRYGYLLPAGQRRELEDEIRLELKSLPVREAMWLLGEGRRKEALALILRAARISHSLVVFRPWLGALRRALLT
jgi:glycosyltransferase involved in cell wall biosynthesis